MNKTSVSIVVAVIALVVIGGLVIWYFVGQDEPLNTNDTIKVVVRTGPPNNTVWIVNGSFSPSVVTVKAGDKVTWINKDEIKRKVSSENNLVTDGIIKFESEELAKGGSYSYTFNKEGLWGYYDDLNPIKRGAIVVE